MAMTVPRIEQSEATNRRGFGSSTAAPMAPYRRQHGSHRSGAVASANTEESVHHLSARREDERGQRKRRGKRGRESEREGADFPGSRPGLERAPGRSSKTAVADLAPIRYVTAAPAMILRGQQRIEPEQRRRAGAKVDDDRVGAKGDEEEQRQSRAPSRKTPYHVRKMLKNEKNGTVYGSSIMSSRSMSASGLSGSASRWTWGSRSISLRGFIAIVRRTRARFVPDSVRPCGPGSGRGCSWA